MNRLPKHDDTEAEQFRADYFNRMSEKYKARNIISTIIIFFLVSLVLYCLKLFGIL